MGVGVYNFALKSVPLSTTLRTSAVLGCVLGMTQLVLITGLNREWGLSDELFVLGDSVMLVVLGQVAFMPLLVLAARICPQVGTCSCGYVFDQRCVDRGWRRPCLQR